MVTVEEAKKAILKHTHILASEKRDVEDAFGFVLAKDIYSPVHLPPFDQSGMDGYAVIFDDVRKNKNISVVGESSAGSVFSKEIKKGQAVRIFTGAKIPKGADTVIMQEKVKIEDGHLQILDTQLVLGANVRKKSSQILKGALALNKSNQLNAGAIGYIAGMGIKEVKVYKKPLVTIIVTGSELQKSGTKLKTGNIYESNSATLIAALKSIHIDPIEVKCVEDNESKLIRVLKKAEKVSDIVLLTGGISVGDYDFVGSALNKMKVETIFYKVKQKPGKPLFFGKHEKVLFFALPGNPAAVLSCFYNYVYPAVRKIQGDSSVFLTSFKLPIKHEYQKKKGLANFLKSRIVNNFAVALDGQESYKLSSFANANAIIYLSEDMEMVKAGTLVDVYLLP